jgi:hypothetical protein
MAGNLRTTPDALDLKRAAHPYRRHLLGDPTVFEFQGRLPFRQLEEFLQRHPFGRTVIASPSSAADQSIVAAGR